MFIVDRILIGAPVAGLKFVLQQIADMAERELWDEGKVREDIIALHRAYEQGAIDEATYTEEERILMARWRAARARQRARR